MLKRLYRLGIVVYVFLVILAILFYKERVVFSDFAYYIFLIVKDNTFISTQRLVTAIPELPAVLARKTQMPLSMITSIYSVSLILYYFLCYLVCGGLLKQYRFAVLLLLTNVLFISDSFYMPQNELFESVSLLVVAAAIIAYENDRGRGIVSQLFVFIALTTAGFGHMLVLFPSVYLFAFFFLDKNKYIKRSLLYIPFIFFVIIFLLKKYVFLSQYDAGRLDSLNNFISLFPNYFDTYSFHTFVSRCYYVYYWMPIFWIGIIIFYIIEKSWYKLALFVVFSFGYLLLINVCFPNSDVQPAYIEIEYMPLAVILGLPFMFDIFPRLQYRYIGVALIPLVVITGCLRIWATHSKYTARLNWERAYLKKNGDRKLVVDFRTVPMDTLMMEWASPFEFWILSTIETDKTASILITNNVDQFSGELNNTKAFIGLWGGVFQYDELPDRYFHFKDTVTSYHVVK